MKDALKTLSLTLGSIALASAVAGAQPPPGPPQGPDPLMGLLDADHDGLLSAKEIEGAPKALLARDENGDGQLTSQELHARPEGPGGPEGRPGPEDRRGPGGRQGLGGRGGPDGPGQGAGPGSVLPPFARNRLDLTSSQREQIEALDAEVRGKLLKILTAEQRETLEDAMRRGPGGGGPGPRPEDGGGPPERPRRPEPPRRPEN